MVAQKSHHPYRIGMLGAGIQKLKNAFGLMIVEKKILKGNQCKSMKIAKSQSFGMRLKQVKLEYWILLENYFSSIYTLNFMLLSQFPIVSTVIIA